MKSHFDWLCTYADLREPLGSALAKAGRRALVLGCGTSRLTEDLATEYDVVSVDREIAVIQEMRQRRPDLKWICADVDTFEESNFDVVFDKSTADAYLAERGDVAALADCARRALKRNGLYIVVSLYPARLLEPLLAGFFHHVTSRQIFRRGARVATAAVFRRREEIQSNEALRQRAVLQEWFATERPLFTPSRLRDLEAKWLAARNDLGALDASTAYRLIFDGTPESKLYDLDAFIEDRRRWKKQPSEWDFASTVSFLQDVQ